METRKKQHLLFGEEAVEVFAEDGLSELLKQIKAGEVSYAIEVFDPEEDSALDLLGMYNGWYDFYALDEEEYNKIKSL